MAERSIAADASPTHPTPTSLDLDHATMQRIGRQVADFVAEHLATLREQPAFRTLDAPSARKLFDAAPPADPTAFEAILEQFRERVVPHHAREPHPRFLGYIPSCPTFPAVMGDWLATGFNFAGYDTVYIADAQAMTAPLFEESQAFDLAKRLVQEEFAAAIQEKRLFQNVVTRESDIRPGAKVLKLETTITQFRKGGDGTRPVIGVYGRMLDNAQPMFQFESRRIGRSEAATVSGEIRTMAKSLAEFIRSTAVQTSHPHK